ncbi:MAG: hypothetical protein IPP77_07095 [Bacteroidetes bacterium]|nr:hypothetical protein [Bacteroidota bacterium]
MKRNKRRSLKLKSSLHKDRLIRSKNQQTGEGIFSSPLFFMVFISLNLRQLTSAEKVLERLRKHIFMLTGNLHFPVIDPSLLILVAMANKLEVLIQKSANGNREFIEKRRKVTAEAKELILQLSFDIQKKSGGIAEKIHSAGFDIRKARSSKSPCLKAVIKVIKPLGNHNILLKWKRDAMASIYLLKSVLTRRQNLVSGS